MHRKKILMRLLDVNLFFLTVLTAGPVAGEGRLYLAKDAPVAQPPVRGKVEGTISPPEKVSQLTAVSRVTSKTYKPTSFDKQTGRFVFEKLPGDARYDIRIRTTEGSDIEGIDLDFVDQRLIRLAKVRRKQLALPPEQEHKFTRGDAEAIKRFIAGIKDFCDIRRVLYIRGHGRRATALVELMRVRKFHDSYADECIWRAELWYFEHRFGGWERLSNQERVLRRERLPLQDWSKLDVTYYPQLSVYVDPSGQAEPVEFKIPEKADTSRGRAANTEPQIQTVPHVFGIDAETKAASQPSLRN